LDWNSQSSTPLPILPTLSSLILIAHNQIFLSSSILPPSHYSSFTLAVGVGLDIDDYSDSLGGDDLDGRRGREGGFEFFLNAWKRGDDRWTEVESEGSG